MSELSELDYIAPFAKLAAATNPVEEGDYYDGDGFLMCGKCHTRREIDIKVPEIMGQGPGSKMRVRAMCKCRMEAEEREKAAKQREKDMEAIARLADMSLMDEKAKKSTFDRFEQTKDNARNLKLCRRYAEHFDEMQKKNQGLLFWGETERGKTFAAACIANHLLSLQIPVVMTSFVQILSALEGFREDEVKLVRQLNKAELLIIDDLGAERSTDFALEKVYNIIDSRYRAEKPMILTTNLTLTEMQEATDRRYARIYSRIFEFCYPMQFVGKPWRKAEAFRRFNEMEKFLEGTDG